MQWENRTIYFVVRSGQGINYISNIKLKYQQFFFLNSYDWPKHNQFQIYNSNDFTEFQTKLAYMMFNRKVFCQPRACMVPEAFEGLTNYCKLIDMLSIIRRGTRIKVGGDSCRQLGLGLVSCTIEFKHSVKTF